MDVNMAKQGRITVQSWRESIKRLMFQFVSIRFLARSLFGKLFFMQIFGVAQ